MNLISTRALVPWLQRGSRLVMDSGSKSRVGFGLGMEKVRFFPPGFRGFVTKIHVELGFGYHFLWSGQVRIAKRLGFFPRVF